jgi:hypothetical protein
MCDKSVIYTTILPRSTHETTWGIIRARILSHTSSNGDEVMRLHRFRKLCQSLLVDQIKHLLAQATLLMPLFNSRYHP